MARAAVSGPRIGKIVTKTQLMNTAAVTSHPTRGASCHSPQATTATAATIPTTAERAARVRTGMNRGAPVGSGRMLVMIPPSHEATSGSRLSPQMSPRARAGHSRRGWSCRQRRGGRRAVRRPWCTSRWAGARPSGRRERRAARRERAQRHVSVPRSSVSVEWNALAELVSSSYVACDSLSTPPAGGVRAVQVKSHQRLIRRHAVFLSTNHRAVSSVG
jgi:hypothetical protein